MALDAGSCTVATNKTVSGSGLARAMAEAHVSVMTTVPGLSPSARALIAQLYDNLAAAIIDHITANAEVTTVITTADVSLQRVTLVNTQGPSADRTLAQKGTIA